jgi:hypothetical protein
VGSQNIKGIKPQTQAVRDFEFASTDIHSPGLRGKEVKVSMQVRSQILIVTSVAELYHPMLDPRCGQSIFGSNDAPGRACLGCNRSNFSGLFSPLGRKKI